MNESPQTPLANLRCLINVGCLLHGLVTACPHCRSTHRISPSTHAAPPACCQGTEQHQLTSRMQDSRCLPRAPACSWSSFTCWAWAAVVSSSWARRSRSSDVRAFTVFWRQSGCSLLVLMWPPNTGCCTVLPLWLKYSPPRGPPHLDHSLAVRYGGLALKLVSCTAFPLDRGLAAYLPGPVPAGSEHLASAVPSPERWQPDCAGSPSTSQTVPSSQTPSGTRPRQRQGRLGLAGGQFFLLAAHGAQ